MCVLWAWEVLAAKIHQQLMEVYGTDVMFRQQVAKCCCTFPSGKDSVMEGNQSGKQSFLTTEVNTSCIEELIQMDKTVTVWCDFSLSSDTVQHLTFMGRCIVNVFLSTTNKLQRYTIFFIIVSALHVLSGFSAHHQELKNCTCSIGY
jgi:hypothetical protein